MKDREAQCLDSRSLLPIIPSEAMVRQAEVDAAHLAVEVARADPFYQSELQAKATDAREQAHCLRAAMARPMPYDKAGAIPVDVGKFESAPEAVAYGVE